MESPIVQLKGLRKAFGDHVLFDSMDLEVLPGETLAIIGESGCGKSILLKVLIGLIEADGGEILFKGDDVREMDLDGLDGLRRQVGYVFQNDALFDSMTVLENIGYAMREHTASTPEEIRTRAIECLEKVGLEAWRLDLYPSELSGGQRKRVGIARAVAIKPEVVFYDEPTQGLDPQSITLIGKLVEGLQRELSATSILVTHDMRTAFTVANRIALMHEGRFHMVGTPQEFANSTDDVVQEFIADALEELRTVSSLFGESAEAAEAAPPGRGTSDDSDARAP